MKVQKTNGTSFKSLNNPHLLKVLKAVGENNALISSGAMLVGGCVIKPVVTLLTPETKRKDKEYIATKSISSALVGFGLTNAIFSPLSKSLKKIGKNPEKFLKKDTIKKLQGSAETLADSKAFNFLEQSIKMSSSALAILPKAVLTTALITPLVKTIFDKDKKKKEDITFKGLTDKAVSKIIDNKKVQNFAIKNKDSSIIQHMMNARDIIATACFIGATSLNKKIDKKEKAPLAINSVLSTGITVAAGLGVKKLLDKPMDKLLNNFEKANPNLKNIEKYKNGIKVLEPIAILGSIYYILTPIVSTFITGKISNKVNKDESKQN